MEIKSEKDLHELINNKIEESTTLDYKSLDSLNDNEEIAKDVSAMANSEGGIIIYGIKEDERHFPKELEWSSNKQLKDKIDQVLSSRINRKIEGCEIHEVCSSENNEKFVIVVNIPRSDIAPHQVSKSSGTKKYYRRSNSTTREMEQGEIEDLFFKRKRPKLKIQLKANNSTKQPIFEIVVLNEGKVLAEKVFSMIKVPEQFRIDGPGWAETSLEYGLRKYEYFNQSKIPFFPEMKTSLGRIYLPAEKRILERFRFIFMIVCEDMEIVEGFLECDFLNPFKNGEFTETVILKKGDARESGFVQFS